MPSREEFLEARKLGVGGSDAASLLNIGWGCRRRLWYDKRSVPEDYPREETKAMALGILLEPWFAEQYAEATGRRIVSLQAAMVHPTIPELRVNVDRMIFKTSGENERGGILEIKSVGRAAFYKYKREGLPLDYVLQLQHGMLVTGAAWGSFAIGSRDSGELLSWDVAYEKNIGNEILTEAQTFWRQVENGPAPDALEPDDKRCQRCEFRKTCQGNALIHVDDGEIKQDESLRPLVDEYLERKALLAQAEELVDESGEELRAKLGDRQAVAVGDRKIYFRPQAGRTLYRGKEMLAAYSEAVRKIKVLLGMDVLPDLPPPEQFVDTSKPSRPLKIF
jgi:predicted phage-related endonuclease